MKPREKTVVKKALDVFQKTTRIDADLIHPKKGTDFFGDGVVRFAFGGRQWKFEAVVKQRVNRATVALLKQKLKGAGNGLLVTEYVNPELAKVMRDQRIAFIDAAGNAFIDAPPLHIFVKGEKPVKTVQAEPVKRLFKPGGLKLIFALLSNPGLEKATYREMAKAANVALGTVDFAITELKELGFLVDMGKAGRQLTHTETLLRRWVETYPENLRPKLVCDRFKAHIPNWWKDIEPADFEALWGGEIAAAELTGSLKPGRHTIYTDHLPAKLVYRFKLKQDPKGDVEILRPFWAFPGELAEKGLVPPLLIYADLVATGDTRAVEAAEIIHDAYLARLVRQDR